MSSDITLCSEILRIPECITCRRNPVFHEPRERQSMTVPTIKDDKCELYWQLPEGYKHECLHATGDLK